MFYENFFYYLEQICTHVLGFYRYQDYIEVAFFIYITHTCLLWLKQDHTKHLLLYFYAYASLLIASFYTSCTVLFSTLLFFTPALIIFAMIIHQKQLQKNFVLPSKKFFTPITVPQKNWLECLIKSCLVSSHHKKNILCIIERNDHVHALLEAPFILQLPVQQDITDLLLSSSQVTDQSILWLDQSGIIQSINAQWSSLIEQEMISINQPIKQMIPHEQARIMTQKTDAIIFHINTTNNMHTIWYQGTCIQSLTIQELLLYVKEIIRDTKSVKTISKERNSYDSQHTAS